MITSVFRVRCIHFSVLSLRLSSSGADKCVYHFADCPAGDRGERGRSGRSSTLADLFSSFHIPFAPTSAYCTVVLQTLVLFWSHVVDFLRPHGTGLRTDDRLACYMVPITL